MLILQRPWTRQPQGPVRINPHWASSVGFISNPGFQERIDLRTGAAATQTGTITTAPSIRGVSGVASSTSNTRFTWSTTPVADFNAGYAILVIANPANASALYRPIGIGAVAAAAYTNSCIAFNANVSGVATAGIVSLLEYSSSFKARVQSVGGFGATDGNWHVYVANRPAGASVAPSMYVDGVDRSSTSFAAAGVAATVGVHTHGIPVSTTEGYAQGLALSVVFNRPLTANEIAEISGNPWQLFQPRRIYIPTAAAAGGVPTLSASTYVTGSLTSTGWRPQITAS